MRSFGRKVKTAVLHCCAAALALAGMAARGADELPEAVVKPADKPVLIDWGEVRDPFTFRKKGNEPPPPPPGPGEQHGEDKNKVVEPLNPEKHREMRAEAEKMYGEAEQAFMLETGADARTSEVVAKCDNGLKPLDIPGLEKYQDLLQARNRLQELRKAAERVHQRQEAEKKFRDMNIRLTGVVARERHSQAIVNGKPVGKGEVVAVSDNYDVVVDEIRPDHVIFLFQGYKMMLSFTDMPRSR
ncbi:MAG: hypothetical protein ABSE73_19880 [Planctomycetota bacterium]